MANASSSAAHLPPYAEVNQDVPGATAESVDNDIYIAVMGTTGAGKSHFIKHCTGLDVATGESLRSCTQDVDSYTLIRKGERVHLIDTPGFDDTERSDREVLEDITAWMANAYSQKVMLNGILYLHRITDLRLTGAGLRNLRMFKKLCGDEFYPRIYLVTTMWDLVDRAKGKAREAELIRDSDFWGDLISKGANTEQHDGTRDSAMDILSHIIRFTRSLQSPSVLRVQREMIDDKLSLDQTAAGKEFGEELRKVQEKHEKAMAKMKIEIQDAIAESDLKYAEIIRKEREESEAKYNQSKDDQIKLSKTLEDMQKQQAEAIVRLQDQYDSNLAALQEKLQRLDSKQHALDNMDSSSSAAIALRGQVTQDQAEVMQLQKDLAVQDDTLVKKAKRLLIRGQRWAKDNPNTVKYLGVNALRVVSRALAAHDARRTNIETTLRVEEVEDEIEAPKTTQQLDTEYHRSFDAFR